MGIPLPNCMHFSSFRIPTLAWHPAVNVYAYADRFEVCVDLAGVPKAEIDVQIEGRRLTVRGQRVSPEPDCDTPPCGRVLILEISEGEFERELEFPVEVDSERVTARQDNGWLWVTVPMAKT